MVIHNNETKSPMTKLSFKTTGIENIAFVYSGTAWPFDTDPLGEDIMNPLNPEDIRDGLVTEIPFSSTYPRIPAGQMHIDFTLENHGSTLVLVDEIELEITERFPIPGSARMNGYRPVLSPGKDEAVISGDAKRIRIFKQIYKYAPGEADAFRLTVSLGVGTAETIYKFRLLVKFHDGDASREVFSDRSYFLANPNSEKDTNELLESYKKGSDKGSDNKSHIAKDHDAIALSRPILNPIAYRFSEIQKEAQAARIEGAILLASGERVQNRFDDAIDALAAGKTDVAISAFDERIAKLKKFEAEGCVLYDGGAQEDVARFLKIHVLLMKEDIDGAGRELGNLKDLLRTRGDKDTIDKVSKAFEDLPKIAGILREEPNNGRDVVVQIGRDLATGPTGMVVWGPDGKKKIGTLKPIRSDR